MPLQNFFHYNLATNGIRAGHKILAKFGIGRWQVDVEVKPTGGYSPWLGPPEDYYIVVRVTSPSGKKYEQSFIATDHGLRAIQKVVATFKGMSNIAYNISVKIGNVGLKTKKFFVRLLQR